MNIGISTVIYSDFGNCGRNPDLFPALEKLSKMGYRYIEYNDQSIPHPFHLKDVEIKEILQRIDALGLNIHSIHIPCAQLPDGDIGSIDKGLRKESIEVVKRTLDACQLLNVPYAVIHSGGAKENLADIETFKKVKNIYFESIQTICDYPRKSKVKLVIENGGSKLNTVEAIMETINLVNKDKMKICIDTGHANGVGKNPADMIEKAGNLLSHLHIHDNNGTRDEHLIPGEGTINWEKVLKTLARISYQGIFMIEAVFSKNSNDPDIIAEKAIQISEKLIRKYFI